MRNSNEPFNTIPFRNQDFDISFHLNAHLTQIPFHINMKQINLHRPQVLRILSNID